MNINFCVANFFLHVTPKCCISTVVSGACRLVGVCGHSAIQIYATPKVVA